MCSASNNHAIHRSAAISIELHQRSAIEAAENEGWPTRKPTQPDVRPATSPPPRTSTVHAVAFRAS